MNRTLVLTAALLLGCSSPSSNNNASDSGSGTGKATGTGTGNTTGSATGTGTGTGTDGGTSEGGVVAPTPSSECTAYAMAECASLSQCESYNFQTTFGTTDACQTQLAYSCAVQEAAPSTGWTTEAITSCTTFLTPPNCNALQVPTPISPCVFSGALDAGAACALGSQCASRTCMRAGGAPCGTCAALVATAGAACDGGTICDVGMTCNGKGVCVKVVGVSQTCDATQACVAQSFCVRVSADAGSGTCTANSTDAGAVCAANGVGVPDCRGTQGLFCANGLCTPATYASPNAGCGTDAGVVTSCTAGSCRASICTADLPLGSACTVGTYPTCQYGVACLAQPDAGVAGICSYVNGSGCH